MTDASFISPQGKVLGTIRSGEWQSHAALYQNGKVIDLGTLGGPRSGAMSMNRRGDIVGFSDTSELKGDGMMPDGQGGSVAAPPDTAYTQVAHAFIWRNGKIRDIGILPGGDKGGANSINDHGDIVGWSFDKEGGIVAVKWHKNRIRILCKDDSNAVGINNRGEIVGDVATPNYGQAAALWSDHTMKKVGHNQGFMYQVGCCINDRGEIAGWMESDTHEQRFFIVSSGVVRTIPLPSGKSRIAPKAINNRGQVVGWMMRDPAYWTAFLFDRGVFTDLNQLIPANSGWSLEYANGINDNGQIVGQGKHNGIMKAFLLTPSKGFRK